jgi:ribosomal protein S18 acetylase RimI-like enzyme
MDITIRPARPEDYEALGELTVQVYKDLVPQVKETEAYLEQVRDVRSRAEQAELLVAVDNDRGDVLGGVSFVQHGSRHATTARPGEGEFRLLAVASSAQRRGVGEALVRACLDRAVELGLRGVAILTQPDMLSAQRLYTRLGFVRVPERDVEPLPGIELWSYVTEWPDPHAA